MADLHEALAERVAEWRAAGYPHADFPAVGEILQYAVEGDTAEHPFPASGTMRFLRAVELERPAKGRAKVVIRDFMSPSIIERLKGQEGVLSPQIDDWRAMVDSVMVDSAYDGSTFDITLADIAEKKADLVAGTYELDLPADSRAVAVRITDMLGEKVLVVMPVEETK